MIGVAVGAGCGYLVGRWKHHPVLGAIVGGVAPVLGLVIIAVVGPWRTATSGDEVDASVRHHSAR